MEKYQQIISMEPDITVFVRAHGNLDVHQWDRPELGIVTDINIQKLRHENKLLKLVFVDDCELSVPKNQPLIIDRVSENARLRNLENPLTINTVGGKLALQNVSSATVGRVSENVLLENIPGKIKISKVGDDLTGKNLGDSLTVEKISGCVKLQGVGGALEIRADDNVEVGLTNSNKEKISIRSSDSITLHMADDANAALQIRSSGESIQFQINGLNKKINESRGEIRLGTGEQKVYLDSSDWVKVTGEVIDEQEIARLFTDLDILWKKLKEESEIRRAAREKEVHWEIKMVEEAAQVAQEAMDSVEAFANQITDDTIRQAEIHVKEAMKQVEEQIRNLGYDTWVDDISHDETQTEDAIENADITDEEKLIVMRLLQQRKISVEEADRLLQVLSDTARHSGGSAV